MHCDTFPDEKSWVALYQLHNNSGNITGKILVSERGRWGWGGGKENIFCALLRE